MRIERDERRLQSNRSSSRPRARHLAFASGLLVASLALGPAHTMAQAAGTLAAPPPSSPPNTDVPAASEEPARPTRTAETSVDVRTRTLFEHRVDETQRQLAHVHPRLGSGIVGVVLGVGMIVGSVVARPRLIDRVCSQATALGADQIASDCERAFDITSYVLVGAGAILTTTGSIKIVIHSVRRSHARRDARDAQHRLDEFDRDHALSLRPHLTLAPRQSVFGLSLQGSF